MSKNENLPCIELQTISALEGVENGYRLYGMGFPSEKEMAEWKSKIMQLQLNDHKVLGQKYQYYAFNKYSPGMIFWLPKGTVLFNRLCGYLRNELQKSGYEEVKTPQIYNKDLYEKSGHLSYYSNDMFFLDVEKGESSFGLKPMNCPSHCLLYEMKHHSYRDLPLRYCEFTALHRNEASGALTGLTRLRQFHQDDGHIFTTMNKLSDEIVSCFHLINNIYTKFGLKYEVSLSTCPEKFIGNIEDWKQSHDILISVLSQLNVNYDINDKDGAFYGPKIDVYIKDCFERKHQCGTIQLDFQFPKRFNLFYKDENCENQHPILVHRAILGSIERFISVYLEHTNGSLPFWLSPYQLLLIPVSEDHVEYCHKIRSTFSSEKIQIDLDSSEKSLNKKIKLGKDLKYHYIGIIGDKEINSNTITLRKGNSNFNVQLNELSDIFNKELNN